MLAPLKLFSHGFRYTLSCALALGSFTPAFSYQNVQCELNDSQSYFGYFVEYFNSINENTDIDEVIDQLIFLRQSILNQGIQCPTIHELGNQLIQYLSKQNVHPDNDQLREFIQRIEIREAQLQSSNRRDIHQASHKKKKDKHNKKDKELKLNGRTIFGFVSTLAGGLISIVPGCQSVGVGLVVYGISQMMEGTLEQAKENERQQNIDEQKKKEEALLGESGGSL